MAVVLKTTERETVPGVRIPLPPPDTLIFQRCLGVAYALRAAVTIAGAMRSGKRRHPETPHIDSLAVPDRDVVRESRRYLTTECAPP